jgi:uncharacterized protein
MSGAPPSPRIVQLRWFMAAFAAYASVCLVFGWVRIPLFLGGGADGWPTPSLPAFVYMLYMTCLPMLFWLLVAYAIVSRIPGSWGIRSLMVVLLLVLTAMELDHTWYGMSGHHATWREISLFLTEDWKRHYGLRAADVRWFLVSRMSLHILGVCLVSGAAWLGARWKTAQRFFNPPYRYTLELVALLVVIDSLVTGYAISRKHDQWEAVAEANPFRIAPLDRLSLRLFSYGSEHDRDLAAANSAFIQSVRNLAPPAGGEPPHPAMAVSHEHYDIVIVTIEGVNARLSDSTTMPFWTQLAARSTRLANHYSTGNVTEYGVLGVLYGTPPYFYRGTGTVPWRHQIPADQLPPQPGSPYMSELAQHGYHTRLISWELSSWAQLGVYLHNFTEPPFETTDDSKLIPRLSEELHRPGPHLVYMHYNGTHYPYDHLPQYSRFLPEVPPDFDWASWNIRTRAPAITNRYRNCLLELDAWLRSLTDTVDLRHTILIFTGDHGEEFFEHSRLGHASTLSLPQVRTVAMIYVPGQSPRVITAVTSHADIMPTLMDLLGLPQPMPPFGQSLAGPVSSGAAVIAMGNRPNPPTRWAAIAGDSKSILVQGAGDTLRIVQLLDSTDHPVSFSANPNRWQQSFAEAGKLQLRLSASPDGRGARVAGMLP